MGFLDTNESASFSVFEYGNDEYITWRYSTSSNSIFRVYFDTFDTESGYDFLYIYDSNAAQLLAHSGDSLPDDVYTTGLFGLEG